MLVCNVSLLRRRAAIAAAVAEAATAADQPGTGNVVFATLVDDPASVADRVDAYLGQIMVEAASASSTVNAGLAYAAAVVEAATAADSFSASMPGVFSATILETVTAADSPNATVSSVYSVSVSETAAAGATQAASLTVPVARSAMVVGSEPVFINPPGIPISSHLRSGIVVVAATTVVTDASATEAAAATSSETAAINVAPDVP